MTYSLAILATIWQQTLTIPKPFFTDDLTGWVKLGTMYLAGLGVLGTVMVRLAYNAHTKRLDDSIKQLNGLGERVTVVKTEVIECGARVGELKGRVDLMDHKLTAVDREVSRVGAHVENIQKSIAGMQSEIMSAIQASGRAQLDQLHNVQIEVARLDEREQIGEKIDKLAEAILMARGVPTTSPQQPREKR